MTYEYIVIDAAGTSPSGKTLRFDVLNKRSRDLLGVVAWYGPWRQYTFNPMARTTYSSGCLRDIAHYIDALKGGRT